MHSAKRKHKTDITHTVHLLLVIFYDTILVLLNTTMETTYSTYFNVEYLVTSPPEYMFSFQNNRFPKHHYLSNLYMTNVVCFLGGRE
jgi:hypothetical protein